MSLRPCPNCGSDVSDKAASCVHCGHPLRANRTRMVVFSALLAVVVLLFVAVVVLAFAGAAAERRSSGTGAGPVRSSISDQVKARLVSMKTELSNLMVYQEGFFADHGQYAASPAELSPYEFMPPQFRVTLAVSEASKAGYKAEALHSDLPDWWCRFGIGNTVPEDIDGVIMCDRR